MYTFLGEDFLLTTKTAVKLFETANAQPIFDWHCHLSPKEIYENKSPQNIAELWLAADHYKWRAMRSCGLSETLVTGPAEGKEKFLAFAGCLPRLIGNPLYHWAHLELQRYFGRFAVLDSSSAEETWNECNRQIARGGFTPQELIIRSNVRAVITTDDPADSLEYHEALAKQNLPFKVLPAFRPDKALHIDQDGFLPWIATLEKAVGHPLHSFGDLTQALRERIELFSRLGCRASDHGLPYVPFAPASELEVETIFRARLLGEELSTLQVEQYQTALLQYLGTEYAARGWAMELHMSPMRNNNARQFRAIGPDAGYDSIGDWPIAQPLSRFLDSLEAQRKLPKTILFNLNPRDNYILGTMIGNFQSDEIPGKMQFGPAWWFLDSIDGMHEQLKTLGNLGSLGTFIGMATDSRSFLSYPRHEYFRRILCGLLGEWVEQGHYPNCEESLTQLVKDISFENAKKYFGL